MNLVTYPKRIHLEQSVLPAGTSNTWDNWYAAKTLAIVYKRLTSIQKTTRQLVTLITSQSVHADVYQHDKCAQFPKIAPARSELLRNKRQPARIKKTTLIYVTSWLPGFARAPPLLPASLSPCLPVRTSSLPPSRPPLPLSILGLTGFAQYFV